MKKEAILKKGLYVIATVKEPVLEAFANIKDREERTVIIEQEKITKENSIKAENGYRLITFDMILDSGLVGFIAEISSALAEKSIPIFFVSSYSTDHLLIKEKHLKETIGTLKKLGFQVIEDEVAN